VAAIRAAQLGYNVAVVEEWINQSEQPTLGGTCLNVGCIPSKALLDSSEHYYQIKHDIDSHGISVDGVSLDLNKMIERKDGIVKQFSSGIGFLFKKNKITWLKGHGRFLANNRIEVESQHESHEPTTVEADHVIIATGSVPREIPGVPMDGERIVDSSGALEFREVPKKLGIIGSGVIGLEMGSVWSRLGSEVVILEAMEDFLYFCDEQISKDALREFNRQGLNIQLGVRVSSAEAGDDGVKIEYEDKNGKQSMEVDKLIVAVGRKPNTVGLDLETAGVNLDESGFINVDKYCMTDIPNIFAVGDVVRGPMLAHKGSEEGVMVAERIAGQQTHVNHDTIPWVIYTWPEIAWVGKTEKQLKAAEVNYTVGTFPIKANGRAMALEQRTGFVKVIADADTD
ncbi:MAG: dihydrolipoyl dehydrogenase, partial [Verrucomicrobiota bacterium]